MIAEIAGFPTATSEEAKSRSTPPTRSSRHSRVSQLTLGIDVGSTTVKCVFLDPATGGIVESSYRRAHGNPLGALHDTLKESAISTDEPVRVGISGSGRKELQARLDLPEPCVLTEIHAHALGAWHVHPGARTLIDIGGQDNKLIFLSPSAEGGFAVTDFVMNDLCAAGTGAFLEMLARELGYADLDEFAAEAAQAERAARIAARCSVLAQSDIVHLRQQGEDRGAIAAGLCRAVVRNVLAMAGGRQLAAPILFQGGVASNRGVVKALAAELGEGSVIVPSEHRVLGALGAALHAASRPAQALRLPHIRKALEKPSTTRASQSTVSTLAPLQPLPSAAPAHTPAPAGIPAPPRPAQRPATTVLVLGCDVGSASVKLVALDESGSRVFEDYRLHDGRPIESLYQSLGALSAALGPITVKGLGVTGSGRDRVELVLGADVNTDEITAQGAGAVLIDKDVTAIFEIGGQDSKYIGVRNGRVDDFEMNRICAAGTGAFLAETARILGVSAGAGLDALAFGSTHPCALNSRCCVFAKSDIIALLNSGESRSDVAAGVAYAIARNYLNGVVGRRAVGTRALLLGGAAKHSQAVVAAFRALLPGVELVAPPEGGISGAWGAARLTWEKHTAGQLPRTAFRGIQTVSRNEPVSETSCNGCANTCRIQRWKMTDGSTRATGGICDRHEGGSGSGGKASWGRNFVREYMDLIRSFEPGGDDKATGTTTRETTPTTIGVPRALLYYEQGPFWTAYLKELGFSVALSEPRGDIVQAGTRHVGNASVCLPIKVLVGHVAQLVAQGVHTIFLPRVVETQRHRGASRSDACMMIQGAPDAFLKAAFPETRFIMPTLCHEGRQSTGARAMVEAGVSLGASRQKAFAALRAAGRKEAEFRSAVRKLGQSFADEVARGAPCVVLLGRLYSLASELDMGIPRHFARLGISVAPMAILPWMEQERLENRHFDIVFQASQDLVMATNYLARQPRNVFPALISQFLCRQDAAVHPLLSQRLGGRPSLKLSIDENSGEAGFKTRCAAFAHVIRQTLDRDQSGQAGEDPFQTFVPNRAFRRFKGTVWVWKHVRFYAAALNAIGIRTGFMPDGSPDIIERGRKYFPNGQPCLPFVENAGSIEALTEDPRFNPDTDVIHAPGTRHCASATVPYVFKDVLRKLGLERVPVLSPRDGLDVSEAVETFGINFVRSLGRAMVGGECLKKLLVSIRPYEVQAGETDRVYAEVLEQFYGAFTARRGFYKTLKACIARLVAIPTTGKGSRPRILVTGEYITRTSPFLNDDVHRRIESLGGETLYTPLFMDYVELLIRRRPAALWKLGRRFQALREAVLLGFSRLEVRYAKSLFAPHLPDGVDPDPTVSLTETDVHMDPALDACMRLELTQAIWAHNHYRIHGIVSVAPFGCAVSAAVAPMVHEICGKRFPVLSLLYDGQRSVHTDNRLAAFMESVRAREHDTSSLLAAHGPAFQKMPAPSAIPSPIPSPASIPSPVCGSMPS